MSKSAVFPQPGDRFPAFTLPDQRGRATSLKSLLGRVLVVFCYPEADTPLCTREACGLRDSLGRLERLGAGVVGISPDEPAAVRAFAEKFALGFPLLADARDGKGVPRFLERVGVYREKNMYGRRVMGIVRTTFILDEGGVVAHRLDHVKVPTHAQRVERLVAQGRAG